MLKVKIDNDLLDRGSAVVEATNKQVYKARTRALIRLRKHVETALKREAAKQLRIPQKAIADRFFSNAITDVDEVLRVWFGEWNIDPYSIGTPRQTVRGVRAGRRSYRGAFLGSVYTPEEKIWIRLRSPHYSPDLYPAGYRPGDRGMARDNRFPVVRAAVPVDGVMEKVVLELGDSFALFFERTFLSELNYQVNVKGGRA